MGGCGVIYQLKPTESGPWRQKLLHKFSFPEGAQPNDGLIMGPDGTLYGTATLGGSLGGGTVFRFDSLERGAPADPAQFTIVHAFANRGPGWRPLAPPVRGSDGGLYGLTNAGGANGRGDAYRVVVDYSAAPTRDMLDAVARTIRFQ